MKFLSLISALFLLSMSMSCNKKLVRPKGSDIEWQQRQEQQRQEEQANEDLPHKRYGPEAARGFESY